MNSLWVGAWSAFADGLSPAGPWGQYLFLCGLGSLILAGCGMVATHWIALPRGRLTLWRGVMVLTLLFMSVGLVGWERGVPSWRSESQNFPLLESPEMPPQPISSVPGSHRLWPALIMGLGSVLLGIRHGVQWLQLRQYRRQLAGEDSLELHLRFASLVQRLGLRRVPELARAQAGQGPLVFGILRPVLVVPEDFERTFSSRQQEAILAHELGHLLQNDPLWQRLGQWLGIVAWWNPVILYLLRCHIDAGESAADEATQQVEDGPGLLAESLVILGQRLAQSGILGPLWAQGRLRSRLGQRVERLLSLPGDGDKTNVPRTRGWVLVGWLGLAGVLAVGGLVILRGTGVLPPSGEGPLASLWTPFQGESAEEAPRGNTPGRRPPSPGLVPAHPIVVRAAKSSRLPGPVAVVPPGMDRRSEEDILGRLGLSPEQRRRMQEALQRRDSAIQTFRVAPSGHVELGIRINQQWRREAQQILTPEQWQRYHDYWVRPRERIAAPIVDPSR